MRWRKGRRARVVQGWWKDANDDVGGKEAKRN